MNEPKIGEKVKFWEEQDRINHELIPRVIKGHELLTKHVESHEDGDSLARAQIEALGTKLTELRESVAARADALEQGMAERHDTAMARIDALEQSTAERHETDMARINALKARISALEARAGGLLSRWIPYVGLAVAAAALVLALVR